MHLAVIYRYNGDTATMDAERPAHREFLSTHPNLLLSGPTADGGAILVFEDESADQLESWLDDDPFWTVGVIDERTVTPWSIVLGSWREQLGL
jgi:uncharacterized protein